MSSSLGTSLKSSCGDAVPHPLAGGYFSCKGFLSFVERYFWNGVSGERELLIFGGVHLSLRELAAAGAKLTDLAFWVAQAATPSAPRPGPLGTTVVAGEEAPT